MSRFETEPGLSDAFWRRWYVYAAWPTGLIFFISLSVLKLPGGPELGILLLVAAIPLGLWTWLGFYWDASVLSERDWQPWWPVWVLGTVVLSPVLICSFYLLKRSFRTGVPWRRE
jgi:hypothetical protein